MNDFSQEDAPGLHTNYYGVIEIIVVFNQLLTKAINGDVEKI
jgi:hypothetical protein